MNDLTRLWSRFLFGEEVDRRSVIKSVYADSGWTSHFLVMTLLSAGIAILGLLLSSPAVVIGAMLISPLMGPIIGLGFGIATFDFLEIKRSSVALAAGIVLALLLCALISFLSPLHSVTSEIASRTRPNLFDLMIALFSGLAGSYAVIRGRHGAIVGVAIATALMPPLAVMGFGLATANWAVLGGSSLLFFTNLMTIAVSAAVLARLYGFAPHLSSRQSRLQATLIIATLIALAVPLGLSLAQIAQEALANRQASDAIAAQFPKGARISDLAIDYHSDPVSVTATVLTPAYEERASANLSDQLRKIVGRPVGLSLDQIRTAGSSTEGRTDVGGASAAQRSAARMADRIALVAGVPVANVLVDRVARRVTVRATSLPGATFETYRLLEKRVAATDGSWAVMLVPPVQQLPDVVGADGSIDQEALDTAVWAAQRLGLPVSVTGPREEASNLADAVRGKGVDAVIEPGRGKLSLAWATAPRHAPEK
jgi:uncharacterized hydrophobic protein (TIGR00271 family)